VINGVSLWREAYWSKKDDVQSTPVVGRHVRGRLGGCGGFNSGGSRGRHRSRSVAGSVSAWVWRALRWTGVEGLAGQERVAAVSEELRVVLGLAAECKIARVVDGIRLGGIVSTVRYINRCKFVPQGWIRRRRQA
jgi:hypothetical protein